MTAFPFRLTVGALRSLSLLLLLISAINISSSEVEIGADANKADNPVTNRRFDFPSHWGSPPLAQVSHVWGLAYLGGGFRNFIGLRPLVRVVYDVSVNIRCSRDSNNYVDLLFHVDFSTRLR